MKKKIAEYEYDFELLEKKLYDIAELLLPENFCRLSEMTAEWIDSINYYVLPKSFDETTMSNETIITNDMIVNNPVSKVNFFIDMPIELHILECLWTVLIGKVVYDKKLISNSCYGNCIDNYVLYNGAEDFFQSINFSKNKLFKIYFNQYCAWKNNAIEAAKECNVKKQNVVLFSLDIKSYYYSVRFKFSEIEELLEENSNFKKIYALTKIVENIFLQYTKILRSIRILEQGEEETVFPIGLFSSMLLANLYMSKIDKKISEDSRVKYYGRYVDDMLILVEDIRDEQDTIKENFIKNILVDKLGIIRGEGKEDCSFVERPELIIQKNKVKIIYFEGGKSDSLIKKLERIEKQPSQMDIVPAQDISLVDFEESAYLIKNFSEGTKIRDVERLEIDKFGLGRYLAQFVRISSDKSIGIKRQEKIYKEEERKKIIKFFQKSRCLEYSSNWINVLYIMLLSGDQSGFRIFEKNVRIAIQEMTISEVDGVYTEKKELLKGELQDCLLQHFSICVAVVLALNPEYNKKEVEIRELAIKIRQANLFNHHLVTFPLINYVNDLREDIDLSNLSIDIIRGLDFSIVKSPKIKWSPRFISLDEIFLWVFLINEEKGGNCYSGMEKSQLNDIINFFYAANSINSAYTKRVNIDIRDEQAINGYVTQFVNLGERIELNKNRRIKIAIVNARLDIETCAKRVDNTEEIGCSKREFYSILQKAQDCEAEFLLFPEFYLPIEWLNELLAFARKTKITVITGLNYIVIGRGEDKRAINNVAAIIPFTTGCYKNCFLLVREKNDYAPLERKILALKRVKCFNQDRPNYQVFFNKGIRYGIFLCYEFTDIVARALYKNKVDMLFTPEHNNDTSYFSSIIESMTRDLHTFVIQANTSIYGDSRITGPYSRDDRNIVQIKGGEDTSIIVGTIELGKVREYQDAEKEQFNSEIEKLYNMSYDEQERELQKIFDEKEKKIAKMSARTHE